MHRDTRKILACTGHQLIPDPLGWHTRNKLYNALMDLGSVKEFMMYDRARRRYYASRFSLFVSYGVNSTATMPGPASVRSLARKRGPVYDLWPIGLGCYARQR